MDRKSVTVLAKVNGFTQHVRTSLLRPILEMRTYTYLLMSVRMHVYSAHVSAYAIRLRVLVIDKFGSFLQTVHDDFTNQEKSSAFAPISASTKGRLSH